MRRALFCYVTFYILGILAMYYLKIGWIVILFTITVLFIQYNKKIFNFNHKNKYFVIFLFFLLGCIMMYISCYEYKYDNLHQFIDKEANYTAKVKNIIKNNNGYKLVCNISSVNGQSYEADFSSLITTDMYMTNYTDLIGGIISFNATLKLPDTRRNPRCFDYRLYLQSKRITTIAFTKKITLINSLEDRSYFNKIRAFSEIKKNEFLNKIPKQSGVRDLIAGIMFGQVSALNEDIYDDFKENGTAHILAVSGLHMGIIYSLFKKIAGRKKGIKYNSILMSFILFYAFLSNFSISVIRASVMIILNAFSFNFDRSYDVLSSLSLVAFIILVYNPYLIFSQSFQMSFLAILSISFISPFLYRVLKKDNDFLVLIAVQIGMIPYMIYNFNSLSLLSIFINIPIVYLAGIIVPIGLITIFIEFIGLNFFPATFLLTACANLTLKLNHFLNLNGFFYRDVVSISVITLFIIYATLFYITSEFFLIAYLRKQRSQMKKICILIFVTSLMINFLSSTPFDKAKVVFLDVGQGDAVHLKFADGDVLLDGGGKKDYNLGEKVLKPYFLKNQIRSLELAGVTHLHMDHYLGIKQLSQIYPIEKLYLDGKIGDKIRFEDGYIRVIWPLHKLNKDEKTAKYSGEDNNDMTVFKVVVNGVSILVTGDLTEEGERDLLNYYETNRKILKADILKIGHHGSHNSTTKEFLDAVSPEIAIIQVGKNNYGHPSKSVIELLDKKGIISYRTDHQGAVGLIIKEGSIKVCTSLRKNIVSRHFLKI